MTPSGREQDLRRRGSGADRHADGLPGADGVTATYSRTAGETVAAALHHQRDARAGGRAGNYDITYNTASFTITTKAASVTPNAASKTYGDADPALTGTLVGFLAARRRDGDLQPHGGRDGAGGPTPSARR